MSVSPHMILRWVNLPTLAYCRESCDLSRSCLKGQSNEIFDMFFHNSSLSGPLSNGLKYFRFWLRFLELFIWISRDWLRAVSYCGESSHFLKLLHRTFRDSVTKIIVDSYSTKKGIYFVFLQKSSRTKFFLTPCSMILKKIQITQRNLNKIF